MATIESTPGHSTFQIPHTLTGELSFRELDQPSFASLTPFSSTFFKNCSASGNFCGLVLDFMSSTSCFKDKPFLVSPCQHRKHIGNVDEPAHSSARFRSFSRYFWSRLCRSNRLLLKQRRLIGDTRVLEAAF